MSRQRPVYPQEPAMRVFLQALCALRPWAVAGCVAGSVHAQEMVDWAFTTASGEFDVALAAPPADLKLNHRGW